MGKLSTDKIFMASALSLSLLALSGCVGGTTYGTGVTQEEQLLRDLEGMLSVGTKKKKVAIDHSARPDLVMPPKTASLPQPLDQETSSSNVNWPENPEARLRKIRDQAEQADPRSGEISVEEMRRKKVGLRVSREKHINPEMDRDGHAAIEALRDGTDNNVKKLKKKYAYSNGPRRKYLTEPPTEYRRPVNTAPVGDLGISEAEKERRAEKAAKLKRENDTGMWTD